MASVSGTWRCANGSVTRSGRPTGSGTAQLPATRGTRGEGLFDVVMEIPAIGNRPASQLDAKVLVPRLTQDVLIHTWDLARAVGADDRLDPAWCAMFFDQLPTDPRALSESGMFAAPGRRRRRRRHSVEASRPPWPRSGLTHRPSVGL